MKPDPDPQLVRSTTRALLVDMVLYVLFLGACSLGGPYVVPTLILGVLR